MQIRIVKVLCQSFNDLSLARALLEATNRPSMDWSFLSSSVSANLLDSPSRLASVSLNVRAASSLSTSS